MKTAIFARVSTNDGRQSNDRQVNELLELCARQNWQVAEVITEQISSTKSRDQRPGLERLIDLAQSHSIQKVVISEISRLGRNVSDGIHVIDLLAGCGVSIYVANIGLETLLSDGKPNYLFRPILLTLMGFAELEREQLRERIRSGLDQARRSGKQLGRPQGSNLTPADYLKQYPAVTRELRSGLSIRKTAKLCDVSAATVQKVKRAMVAS